MKIAILGPKGTFSEDAARKYSKDAEMIFCDSIRDVFEYVKKTSNYGIVPIENSIAGQVGQTLNYLWSFGLKIRDEIVLSINHNLASFGEISKIKKLFLHQQTFEQCELFIRKNLPSAEIKFTSSNGKSAQSVTKEKNIGAIIPASAAIHYKIPIIRENVQDIRDNYTRFLVISKNDHEETGNDRTSIAIYPEKDEPGLLKSILEMFSKNKINLTKIESRPSRGKLGDYIFYMDFLGHRSDSKVAVLLIKLDLKFKLRVFGSYPRRY